MKQFLLSVAFIATSFLTLAQATRTCCPIIRRDTLAYAEISNLHTTPVTLFIPPATAGARIVKPCVLYNHCSASGMTFASGEFITIFNDASVMGDIQQFSDPAVMVQGIYSAYHFQTYEIVRNGQPVIPGSGTTLNGAIKVKATFPVTGSPGDYWIIETQYEHVVF